MIKLKRCIAYDIIPNDPGNPNSENQVDRVN